MHILVLPRMKPYILLLLLVSTSGYVQSQKKLGIAVMGMLNQTQYDITKRQNRFGVGMGATAYYKLLPKLRIAVEANKALFGGTKEFIVINGQPLYPKEAVSSLYAGIMYPLSFPLSMGSYIGFHAMNGKSNQGLRQTASIAFSKKEKFFLRISFDHIFQKNELRSGDFGFWGYAVVARIF